MTSILNEAVGKKYNWLGRKKLSDTSRPPSL